MMLSTATTTTTNNKKMIDYGIPDLSGKTVLITGGNSGLGLKTALELARNNAHVTITCRSATKGEQAVALIKAQIPTASIDYGICDLCSLRSVKQFIDTYKTTTTAAKQKLDILVAQAGISPQVATQQGGDHHQLTEDNQELMMQANHLGHFALIRGLFPLLLQSKSPRVVSCNSGFLVTEYVTKPIDFNDFNWSKRASKGEYNLQQAYLASRVAQQQMTIRLNQEFQKEEAAAGAVAVMFEPGLVKREQKDKSMIMEYLRKPVEEGVRTHLMAATDPNLKPNDFIEPHRFAFWGSPYIFSLENSKWANDQNAIDQLWDLSNDIVQQAWGGNKTMNA